MSKCLEHSYGGTVVLNVVSMEVRYTAWKEEGDEVIHGLDRVR